MLWAGMALSMALPAGAPELGVQPSRNRLLKVLVKMLMIFGLGFFVSPSTAARCFSTFNILFLKGALPDPEN